MEPFELRTSRLILNQLGTNDIDAITEYCSEPVFEHFMTTPWPYERHHAEWFVTVGVPEGWSTGNEWTWAIRTSDDGPLLGVVCIRLHSGSIGYWLGADHRGDGIMSEAVRAVVDATFTQTDRKEIRWECVAGNSASMRVARSVGFTYTGEAICEEPSRTGEPATSWTAVLRRNNANFRSENWPA